MAWATLAPVCAEEILGRWKGADFATGHPVRSMLVACRWYGRCFDALDDAEPLVCRAEDGGFVSNTVFVGRGEASLWNVEFRSEVTATMVYTAVSVADHSRG